MTRISIKSYDKTSEDEQLPKELENDAAEIKENNTNGNIIQTNIK